MDRNFVFAGNTYDSFAQGSSLKESHLSQKPWGLNFLKIVSNIPSSQ